MKNLFIYSSLLCLLSACQKFPEGGFYINAKHVFNKDMNHASTMDLISYEVNGIDSTGYLVSNNDLSQMKSYIRFFKYENEAYYQINDRNAKPLGSGASDESLQFTDVGEAWLQVSGGAKLRNVLSAARTWQIVRCKNKEMVLLATNTKKNINYRVILKLH